MRFYKIFFIFIFLLFFSSNILALSDSRIVIEGNDYIDDQAIFSIVGDVEDELDDAYINKVIKALYDTGNFQNIEIELDKSTQKIIIKVDENPKIKKVKFSGNKRFKKEQIFEQFNKDDYFIYFNEKKIETFVNNLKELYLSFGYNQIDISYEISKNSEQEDLIDIYFNIAEGKISKINNIYFIGNDNFTNSSIMDHIKSKPRSLLRILNNVNYKEFEVRNDVIRIMQLYQNNGFKDIEVEYKSEFINSKNRFNIYFYINEGPKYLYNTFELVFDSLNLTSEQTDQLNSILIDFNSQKIEKNNSYNISRIDDVKEIISEYLYQNGIVFFSIKVLENIDNFNVSILLNIEPVTPKYVNQINIYGNNRTLDKVVRRELTFAEGDAINDELIKNSNRNLNQLNIFKKVSIEEIPIDEDYTDIDVNVEEQSTGEFQVGITFGSLEGVNLITGLKEKNIAGLGRQIDLSINTSSSNTIYNFGIIEPYIFSKKLNLIYGINYQERDNSSASSYNINKFTTNLGFMYELAEDLDHTSTVDYSMKEYEITDFATASSNVKKQEGNNTEITFSNRFVYNKLDSFMRPTKGNYLNYLNNISPVTNSDNGYVKNILTHKKFFKYESHIFSVKSRIGNIFSLQNEEIDTDNKFSLGGRWLRGFDSFGAGPRDSRTSYTGGNNLIVTKLDYQRPLFKNSDNPLDLNLFTDAGTVFGNKTNPSSSNESIRSSYGIGLKFFTPIGPIGFSWAFPITSESYDIERMFLFSIGNVN